MTEQEWFTGSAYDYLPKYGDKSFDLMLADPPYDDMRLINFTIKQGLRIADTTLCFMYAENLAELTIVPDRVVFWVKPVSTKNTSRKYSRFVEVKAVWQRTPFMNDGHWSDRSGVFTDRPEKHPGHLWRKPRALMETLVRNHCPIGGYIIDPFAGTGVIADICADIGINSTSIEIDSRWHRANEQ